MIDLETCGCNGALNGFAVAHLGIDDGFLISTFTMLVDYAM